MIPHFANAAPKEMGLLEPEVSRHLPSSAKASNSDTDHSVAGSRSVSASRYYNSPAGTSPPPGPATARPLERGSSKKQSKSIACT